MTIIGITGPTGAGKTTVLKEIEALGGAVIDCDAVYHEMLESDRALQESLERAFGPLRDGQGAIDRKKLGALVFGDPAKLERLNAIAQRAVVQRTRQMVKENRSRGIGLTAIDAFALLESGLADLCTTTVAVLAPAEARVARIMARGGHFGGLCLGPGEGSAAGPVLCGGLRPYPVQRLRHRGGVFPEGRGVFERDRVGRTVCARARHNKRTMRRAKRPCEIKGGLFYE